MASVAPSAGFAELKECRTQWLSDEKITPHQAQVLTELIRAKNHKLLSAIGNFPKPSQRDQLRKEVQKAVIDYLHGTWNKLFTHCSTNHGKKLSKSERASLGMTRASLVYGEVSFPSFGVVFWSDILDLKPGGVFYDLGSGTGRGVFAAALLHNFDKVIGIEILEGLHAASVDILRRWDKVVRPYLVDPRHRKQQILLKRTSFEEYDWASDADVVFANSTCFDEALMKLISRQGKGLRDGAYVITLTKALVGPHFRTLMSKQYRMSWGYATVHVHQKITPRSSDSASDAVDPDGGDD